MALDVRMYLREETPPVIEGLAAAAAGGSSIWPEDHIDVILPGYTHLQRAQPVLFWPTT